MDDLTKYRLDSAKEKLISAKLLLDAGQYKDSIGRSYYAIFSAVRAVLASRQVVSQKDAIEQYQRAEELLRVIAEFIEKNRE